MIICKAYDSIPLSDKEILRYAQCSDADDQILSALNICKSEALGAISYKVCYCELSVSINEDLCDFGILSVRSKNLSKNLCECSKVIVFAASIGIGIDRLIARYSKISPSKALLLQAIGTERVEALCDAFCKDIAEEYATSVKPRFSPGYGDLPLEIQKDILALLDAQRRIGVTLNDSLLMSPSKSITAFIGIKPTTHSEV